MKWTLPILFLLATTISSGQSKDSTVCLPKSDILRAANRVREMRDTINWLIKTVDWQDTIVKKQDTIIGSLDGRLLTCNSQLENRQKTVLLLEEENKNLREAIDKLMPKWYDNKWLYFGAGATITTIILGVIL